VGNQLGFHGLPHDPVTGLVYARNRDYDPEMGRFVQTDPLGYVDSVSLYQYGLNSPFDFSDPLGLESIRQWFDVESDLVDRPLWGAAKWAGYGAWNIATFGFLAEHDAVYEQTSGGEYALRAGLAVGKAGAKLAVVAGTGGAGAAFGEAAGLGTVATGALTGSAVGLSYLGTEDLFNLAEGKPTHSLGEYVTTAGVGGLLGGLGGAWAQVRTAPVSAAPSSTVADVNPALAQRLQAYRAWKVRAGIEGTPTGAQFRRFVGAHRPGSRGITLYGPRSGFATWSRGAGTSRIHGNSLRSLHPAWLYRLWSNQGVFLKWGISQDPHSRYGSAFMGDKIMDPVQVGPRPLILQLERHLVETKPGPLNLEPWRGAKQ
jgi:RHS repeat-associated protein